MTTVPLDEARADLSRMVDEAVRTHQRVEITRNGRLRAPLEGLHSARLGQSGVSYEIQDHLVRDHLVRDHLVTISHRRDAYRS